MSPAAIGPVKAMLLETDAAEVADQRQSLQQLERCAETLRLSKTYWIICPKATSPLPKITTFREWLLAEAARDARHLQKLGSQHSRR